MFIRKCLAEAILAGYLQGQPLALWDMYSVDLSSGLWNRNAWGGVVEGVSLGSCMLEAGDLENRFEWG